MADHMICNEIGSIFYWVISKIPSTMFSVYCCHGSFVTIALAPDSINPNTYNKFTTFFVPCKKFKFMVT